MADALAVARQRLREAERVHKNAADGLVVAERRFENAKGMGANPGKLKELEDKLKTAETIIDAAYTAVDVAFMGVEVAEKAEAAEAARVHPCSLPGCTRPAPYMCARCRSAYYCSEDHQKADWNRHKTKCRVLSAKAGGRHKSRRSKHSKRKTKRRY